MSLDKAANRKSGLLDTLIAVGSFALVWQLLSSLSPALGLPPFAVPSLGKVGQSLLQITPVDAFVTFARVIGALVLSFFLGMLGAVCMYQWAALDRYLRPLIRIIMAVPVISWVLFAILWFRWVEFRIGFVLVIVCAPVFLVDALDSMRNVSLDLRQMVRSFRPTRMQYFKELLLPAITPGLFTSWKINLSLSIRVVTIAELVGAVTGIGYQLAVAQELFSVADVFAWTLILVVMLFAAEALVAVLERRKLAWRA